MGIFEELRSRTQRVKNEHEDTIGEFPIGLARFETHERHRICRGLVIERRRDVHGRGLRLDLAFIGLHRRQS